MRSRFTWISATQSVLSRSIFPLSVSSFIMGAVLAGLSSVTAETLLQTHHPALPSSFQGVAFGAIDPEAGFLIYPGIVAIINQSLSIPCPFKLPSAVELGSVGFLEVFVVRFHGKFWGTTLDLRSPREEFPQADGLSAIVLSFFPRSD